MLDRALPCRAHPADLRGVASWAALVLAACTGSGADTAAPVATPTPYEYTPDEQLEVVDTATMQAEIQALVDDLRSFRAAPAVEAWFQVREYGDAMCPAEATSSSEANGDVVYFDRLCVVQDRYWFKGPMTSYTFADNTLAQFEVYDIRPYMREAEEEIPWTGRAIKGQTDVYDTQSDLDYNCSCTALIAEYTTDPAYKRWISYMDGPTHFTAPEADETAWMNRGVMSNLWMKFGTDADTDRWDAEIEGSVTGHGDVYGDIYFAMRIGGEQAGPTVLCDPGTEIAMSARHSLTGRRTELTFTFEAGSCEACTDVGDGEVCVDMTPLGAFEDAPW